jgi:hypothetical protein
LEPCGLLAFGVSVGQGIDMGAKEHCEPNELLDDVDDPFVVARAVPD